MKKMYFILFMIFFIGCNFSDESITLPGGHTYVNEGKCYKYILVNIKMEKILKVVFLNSSSMMILLQHAKLMKKPAIAIP